MRFIVKLQSSLLTTFLAATLAFTGCSKSGGSVDATPVEKSFATAEASIKEAATKAVDAVKKADYSSAVAELQKLAADVKLTDEQKKAVADVLAQVQKAVTEMGAKAAGEAGKVLGDAQKALGK